MSSSLPCRHTSSLNTTVALVTATVVAVAVHSTFAAPQSGGDATIKIADQHCKCVPLNMCLSNNTVNVSFRAGNCSSDKVCCINECVNNNVRSCGIGLSPPNTILYSGNTRPRIMNFEDKSNTYFGQFPWMVAILKTDINEKTGNKTENIFICGGTLIHPRVILTAAHCVRGMDVQFIQVRVGMWNTQSTNNEEDGDNSFEDFGISKIVCHPNYDNETIHNDVALVELESEIILHSHVNVICIPNTEKQINYDPQSCVSTGWGQNGLETNSRYQTVLKKVDLALVPNDLCQRQLRTTRLGSNFLLHESFLCAGGIKGVDVCKGDGGGPLICAMKEDQLKSKKYIQVGIVSWGIGCGEENIPGVYASVAVNSQWINKELKAITSQ